MEIHGGNIYKLQREGKKDILDYSSNINPLGVPESLKKAVSENFSVLTRYPDINIYLQKILLLETGQQKFYFYI